MALPMIQQARNQQMLQSALSGEARAAPVAPQGGAPASGGYIDRLVQDESAGRADARNGNVLWTFNAGAGVNATIVTDATGARLVYTSSSTGTDNGFRITATPAPGASTGVPMVWYSASGESGRGAGRSCSSRS